METRNQHTLVLRDEDSVKMANELFHPDEESLRKRDAFLASCKYTVVNNDEENYSVDIPELNLSFIPQNDIN